MANDNVWDLSLPSDELTVEQNAFLEGAPYSTTEKLFVIVIIICTSVGILANLLGLITLIRNRKTGDDEQFILTGLAIADIAYLVSAFVFYVAPIATSPVSQDVPFHHCWSIAGVIIFMQILSAALIVGIAAETYWRATRDNYLMVKFGRYAHNIFVVVLLPLTLLLTTLSAPGIFDEESTPKGISVQWPNSSAYENFPRNINICSQEIFPYKRLVIFQDFVVFWLAVPLLMFFYGHTIKIIGTNQSATGKSDALANELHTVGHDHVAESGSLERQAAGTNDEGHQSGTSRDEGEERQEVSSPKKIQDAVLNLKLRIALYFVLQVGGRLYNLSETIKRHFTGNPLLPFFSVESELVILILRMLLILQPAIINPIIYFFGRGHMRLLLRKTFKFE